MDVQELMTIPWGPVNAAMIPRPIARALLQKIPPAPRMAQVLDKQHQGRGILILYLTTMLLEQLLMKVVSESILRLAAEPMGPLFFALHDNDPSNLIEGEFESSNRVTVYVEDAGVAKVALGTIVSTTNDFNTVDHYVEVCFDFAIGAGSDKVELWVDGVLEDSENGLTVTDAWTLRDIYVGNSNATAHQYTVDNIIFSNDSDAEFYNNGLYDDTSKPTGACP